jgi:hypothetical protein
LDSSAEAAESAKQDEPAEPEEPAKAKEPTWLPAVEYFAAGEAFEIGDIRISPFTTPHDAADPVGFVFAAEGCGWGLSPIWATSRPTSRRS